MTITLDHKHGNLILGGFSRQGPKHIETNTPCQDYIFINSSGKYAWMVIADGVGSARYGRQGAIRACQEVDHAIQWHLDKYQIIKNGEALLLDVFDRIHLRLKKIAKEFIDDTSSADFATTLAIVLIDADCIYSIRIGDGGAIRLGEYFDGAEDCRWLCDTGEIVGSVTSSIHQNSWMFRHNIEKIKLSDVRALAMFTDGAERYFQLQTENPRYFLPASKPLLEFERLAQEIDPVSFNEGLYRYANNPNILELCPDDKSILFLINLDFQSKKPALLEIAAE